MDKHLKIAGDLTIDDWLKMKKSLKINLADNNIWGEAYSFFEKRINTRYLNPIEAIERDSNIEGEGFAITVIICSLIEALETFRLGKVYRRATKDNPLDESREYYKSQSIFENFLKNREPFKEYFSESDLASNFYVNVRCAVLHEAATRNGWAIRIDTKTLIERHNSQYILNRNLFVEAIKKYMCFYKVELLNNIELQESYIRKLDSICETA